MKKTVIWILCAALLIGGVALLAGSVMGVLKHLPGRAAGADALVEKGIRYYQKQQYADAVAALTKAVEKDPSCAEAYFYRGEAYLAMAQNCQNTQEKLEYLALAEADYIRAQALDGSLAWKVAERLEMIKTVREQLNQVAFKPMEGPVPKTPEAEPEAGAAKEGNPQDNRLPSDNDEEETPEEEPTGTAPGNFFGGSSGSKPQHNPVVPPVSDGDFTPDEEPVVSIPPVSGYDEEDSKPTDAPVIDNGEPPVVEIPAPDHNPQILPVDPDGE